MAVVEMPVMALSSNTACCSDGVKCAAPPCHNLL
eukprot:COSAG04_NODE_9306_length_876_cov_0.822394_1_plen_33_part_10